VVKINKQKLIMEEVERFDNISLEDLAEGTITATRARRRRDAALRCTPRISF